MMGRSWWAWAWAWAWACAVAFALAAGAGCKGAPDPQEAARAEEKMNLLTNPALYLATGDREYVGEDAGDVDHQLTSMSVQNTSHFAVGDLTGEVVWFDDQDRRLGTTPFTLRGAIGPGEIKHFSLSDGTMQSGKLHGLSGAVQVAFTHVHVVDAEKGL
jgi:hypothetical protein